MQSMVRFATFLSITSFCLSAQNLPMKWEELTAADFEKAIQKAQMEVFGPKITAADVLPPLNLRGGIN